MRTLCALILLAASILLLVPNESDAIPAFARKYGFNCNMCHVAFIKLNDLGQRFRDNGYQIPGQVGGEKSIFDIAPPLAIRTTTGFSLYNRKEATHDSTTNTFNIYGFDLLAGGVMHKNVSFMFIYTPRIDEPAADAAGPGAFADNPSQNATLESVSLVLSNIVPNVLNLRIGRFEPGYHAISSKRSYYIFQPYEVYAFADPSVAYVFDDNQIGIEATGHCKCGCKYALGVVNGNGGNPDNNKHKDVYLNLSHTFSKGDGQSAGQRIGVFGYSGWEPLPASRSNEGFYRYGAHTSLNWKTLNLQALVMAGTDSKKLNPLRLDKEYQYTGGFAELDWAGILDNRLVASAMYNWVTPPSYDSESEVKAYSGLVRYYLGDWTAVNVALHAEYTYRQSWAPVDSEKAKVKENQFALLMDFDF
jgi:hypothetical protein